jgi:hypothetical protein
MIRYALDLKDPYLEQIVTRIEAGEMRIDHLILDTDQQFWRHKVSMLVTNRRDTERSGFPSLLKSLTAEHRTQIALTD